MELVSVAEDASVQSDEQLLDNVETSDTVSEEVLEADSVIETQVAGKSKGELVDMLAEILESNAAEDIRSQVEQIKTAFYKIHRAQVDARIKEAAEQGIEAEAVQDADELRLKELLKRYRDARDKATAESDKVKEENYRLKCEIIEELKKLGREDIIVVVGGVIPAQDYDQLYRDGAAAIFGPGTKIATAAIKMLEILSEE